MGQSSSTLQFKTNGRRLLAAARGGNSEELAACFELLAAEPLLLLYTNYQGCNLVHFIATEGHTQLLQQLVDVVKTHAAVLSEQLAARLQQEQSKDLTVGARLSQLRQPLLPWCSRSQALQLLQPASVLPTLLSWQNHKRVTPLMLAARAGHADCLALLLSEGANPLVVDKITGRSCLHYAVVSGHTDCVNVMLNEFRTVCQAQNSPYPGVGGDASSGRNQQTVLLQSAMVWDGCNNVCRFVDQRTTTGFSALHYAAYWGCSTVTCALLTAGADVMRSTGNSGSTTCCELVACAGSTPLHLAAANGHRYVAAMLLQAQLQVMSRHQHLQAPAGRLQAAWEGNPGLDPRAARNALGCTAMEVANMQLYSSDLVLLLDPSVPLSWMLQAGGLSNIRFGVPRLADLAKATLDAHLSDCLDQLETAQQQKKQQLAAAKQQAAAAASKQSFALARCCSAAVNLCQLDEHSGAAATPAAVPAATGLHSSASWHAGSSMMAMAAAAAAAPSTMHKRQPRWCCFGTSPAGVNPAEQPEAELEPVLFSSSFRHVEEEQAAQLELQGRWVADIDTGEADDEVPNTFHMHCVSSSSSSNSSSSSLKLSNGSSSHQQSKLVVEQPAFCEETEDGDDDDSTDDDMLCGICFDAVSNVQLAGCCHEMCVACVRSLITATTSSSVPACPFCRRGMAGFVAVAEQGCKAAA